jgi:HAD superfamily hydrolase (TIGR01509 family)
MLQYPSSYKLIIFDLDGTLINAYPAIIDSFNYTRKCLGYPALQPAVIRKAVGWGDKNLLEPFFAKGDFRRALSIYREHHAAALRKKTRLYAGAARLLRLIRHKGVFLAVASNRPTRFSHILLRHLKIESFFNYVLCGDKVTAGKPDPEIFRRILAHFHLPAQAALYVGDMAIDAQAGRRAGIKTIIVQRSRNIDKDLKKEQPYRLVDSLASIIPLLSFS